MAGAEAEVDDEQMMKDIFGIDINTGEEVTEGDNGIEETPDATEAEEANMMKELFGIDNLAEDAEGTIVDTATEEAPDANEITE